MRINFARHTIDTQAELLERFAAYLFQLPKFKTTWLITSLIFLVFPAVCSPQVSFNAHK